MPGFDYFTPTGVPDALALLAEHGADAYLAAGATDLWIDLRAGKLAPKAVVSLRRIEELKGVRREDGRVLIGALTSHAAIEDDAALAGEFTALHQACAGIGSRQVRNVATIGGNICNAAPCADSAVAALLYDGVAVVQNAKGTREIPLTDFFVAPNETVLTYGDITTGVGLPTVPERTFAGYWKHSRRRGVELPLLGVGARVTLAPDRTVTTARIALGVCYPTPARAREAEAVLEGRPLTLETVREAAQVAAKESKVRDTWRGEAWYRREMIRVLIPRVLTHAGALEA